MLTPGLPAAFRYQESLPHPIQMIDTSGVHTGGMQFDFYDDDGGPGRLQPLVTSAGTVAGDFTPAWSYTVPDDETFHLRTFLGDGIPNYLAVVTPLASAADASVSFASYEDDAADLGALTAGTLASSASVFPGNFPAYFVVHAPEGTPIALSVDPPELRVRRLDRYGNTVEEGPSTIVQDVNGWTAVSVDAVTDPPAAIPYTISFSTP
jgi:hypothetical protein